MICVVRSTLILLLVVSIYGYPGCGFQRCSWTPLCQDYDVIIVQGVMQYECKHYAVKPGECPSNTSQYDSSVIFDMVKCHGDWSCPSQFKCCKEKSAAPYHICKKAIFGDNNKDEPTNNREPPAS